MNQGVLVGVGNVTAQNSAFPTYPNTATVIYLASTTWVVPKSGTATFYAVGGGGSGAVAQDTFSSSYYIKCTGGGAGGLSMRNVPVTAGSSYVFTIGAGGPGVLFAGTNTQGVAGGTTTVTGPGVNLTANGGGGGTFLINTASSITGASGGTASGGAFNYTGGGSGGMTGINIYSAFATGGGAVAWRGKTYSSGSITVTSGFPRWLSTGGAGIGGASGNVSTSTDSAVSGGGGAAGPSVNISAGITAAGFNAGGPGNNFVTGFPGINPTGAGGNGYFNYGANDTYSSSSGGGGGGGSTIGSSINGYAFGGRTDLFGGGGGGNTNLASNTSVPGSFAYGGIGGGGGSLAMRGTGVLSDATVCAGGTGMVFVVYSA